MNFAKGLKSEIKEPIIVTRGDDEIDRFTGVFRYMKEKDRELLRIRFAAEPINKAKALEALSKKEQAENITVTDAMIQDAWQPENSAMDTTLKQWFIRGETDDERDWADDTLTELLELSEYRDALFAALKRVATGAYLKEKAAKN